jgi:hypothetical protein
VLAERECKDHIRFGLLERPLGAYCFCWDPMMRAQAP